MSQLVHLTYGVGKVSAKAKKELRVAIEDINLTYEGAVQLSVTGNVITVAVEDDEIYYDDLVYNIDSYVYDNFDVSPDLTLTTRGVKW